ALFNRIESLQTSAEKDEARNALILALDDARAAYDLNEYKYFLGIDFSCLHGLEERLLDHHQLIVPHAQSSLSSIKDTVKSLISPFAKMDSQDIEHGGITRHIYTPLLYQLYAQAAGYRLGPQTKQIYKFKDSVNIENIKQQYLNQFSNVRLRERQEKIFNAAIASMENNSLTVGEDDHNSLIIFFNEKGLLEQREHTQDELIAPESLRTEEEILATMVAEGPFIDRAHLETVLAWHDPNASTETMRNSLLAGLEPSFKEVSPFKESMVMRYNLYVQNQLNRNRYLQFYFMHNDLDTIISWREMRDLPCFQTVLCEYLSKNQIRKTLQKKQLAVFCIKNGYYKALKILLAQGVNPNYEHPYERNTLLSMAIKENHKACIKVLIEAGAKLDFQSWHRPTALMEAAVGGKIESLKFLIEAGAKLDLADQYGDTALIRTVRYRALESMKVLIDAGANIDICGASQCTALMWAARNNHVQSVKLLIQSGANLDVQDCKGNTALMLASLHGGVECIKLLIDAGANLDLKDRDQNTPMMNALKNLEISKIWTLSKGLAGRYFDNFINGILESKIQLQISQNEPDLIRAAKEGDRFTCWRLLQNGTNINRCDKNGHTALDVAIANEHVDLIKELMCYEMNPYHLIQSIRFAVENPKYHHTVSLLFTPKIIEIMLRQQPDAVAWAQKHQCDAAIVALSSGNICIDLNNPFISEESKLVNFKQPLLHSRNLSATQQNRYTHQRP
ncbi:MAG: hypothetical protein FJ161_03195, partial [Gammaproteobacteria bacterium]|nr:hypothetical protein [Gammaproteobacteria bacterium]